MKPTAVSLKEALLQAKTARQAVRENTGYDKEQAREAYDNVITEVLLPTLQSALDDLETNSAVEKLASQTLKILESED